MLILLYGSETYNSMKMLAQMRARFCANNPGEVIDVVELDGNTISEEEWHRAMSVGGFWARKKMVVAKNVLRLAKAELLEKIKEDLETIAKSANLNVIFWEDSSDFKKNPAAEMVKRMKKEKYSMEFKLMDDFKAADWVMTMTKERGGEMEKVAAIKLVAAVGADLWALNNEIDKLLALSAGKIIGIKEIGAVVSVKVEENVFGLLDAIMGRSRAQALKIMRTNLESGMEPMAFLGMVVKQFRMLLILKERSLGDNFLNSKALASEYGWHPFVVQKNLAWVKQYSIERLKEIYKSLEELDVILKTSGGAETKMELFVARLVW